mgnify:CR=1 FL=1
MKKSNFIFLSAITPFKILSKSNISQSFLYTLMLPHFFRDISENFVSEILKLAPFGAGNEKPIFIFRDIIPEKINRFGKANEHLSINFSDGLHNIRAISFFTSPDQFGDALKEGIKTNLVANIEKSFYNGSSEIRLRIVDFFKGWVIYAKIVSLWTK